jgi:spore germination protein
MSRMMKITSVLSLLLLTGCWDRVEIEERGFVVGVGVDLLKKEEREEQLDDKQTIDETPFKLTYQFVEPRGLGFPILNI